MTREIAQKESRKPLSVKALPTSRHELKARALIGIATQITQHALVQYDMERRNRPQTKASPNGTQVRGVFAKGEVFRDQRGGA